MLGVEELWALTLLYLDTSAFARLYTLESDHEAIATALAAAEGGIAHVLTYVELHSALAGCRQRKAISGRAYQAALRDIARDWPTIRHVGIDEQLLQDAAALAGAYHLRAYDAVHLAAAQAVSPLGVQFMTFDLKLWAVAEQVLPGAVWQE